MLLWNNMNLFKGLTPKIYVIFYEVMRKVPLQAHYSFMLEQSLVQFSVEVTKPLSLLPEFSKA